MKILPNICAVIMFKELLDNINPEKIILTSAIVFRKLKYLVDSIDKAQVILRCELHVGFQQKFCYVRGVRGEGVAEDGQRRGCVPLYQASRKKKKKSFTEHSSTK